MGKYNYRIHNNKVEPVGVEGAIAVYDIGTWKPELLDRYRTLLALSQDMDYAKAYLNQMFFREDTSLIDGALINSAIQLLVKCFASQNKNGRRPLNSNRVFVKHAKKMGECDLSKQYAQFYNARNQTLSHDQHNFKENIVGITVDLKNNTAEEIVAFTVRTGYLYKENQQLLLRLINVVQSFLEEQKIEIENMIVDEFNKLSPRPSLNVLKCENVPISVAW